MRVCCSVRTKDYNLIVEVPYTEDLIAKIGENIIKVLKTIYDPEIPVDIYELGLIYDVQISELGDVKVMMTLTAPNCPVADTLPQEVEQKVGLVKGVSKCNVELTFEPTWTKDMMSEEARFELGMI